MEYMEKVDNLVVKNRIEEGIINQLLLDDSEEASLKREIISIALASKDIERLKWVRAFTQKKLQKNRVA